MTRPTKSADEVIVDAYIEWQETPCGEFPHGVSNMGQLAILRLEEAGWAVAAYVTPRVSGGVRT